MIRPALAALILIAGSAACAGPVAVPLRAPAAGSSSDFVRRMGLGWNLGNTLEACGDWIKGTAVRDFETAWGNPETTRAMLTAIRAAGFRSVRIPVAWSNRIGPGHRINPALLDRVQTVVDMVLAEGMVAVVNIHWDGGWWKGFPTDEPGSMNRYRTIWEQIGGRLKDYPETLVFESLNEEGCFEKIWNHHGGGPGEEKLRAYALVNRINQSFVDLIRGSGGANTRRHLLIAGYCTDIDRTVDPAFVLPADPFGRCIVSVHYYTPFAFAGLSEDASWAKARPTWGTPEDLAELDGNMNKLKARFLDRGVPVIVGEYGCEKKNKEPESVRRYLLAVAERSFRLGMCPMLWDAGGHFNRRTLEWSDPALAAGLRGIATRLRAPELLPPVPR